MQFTLSKPSFKALSSGLMLQRSRIAVGTCTPSFVGLTHRVERCQYVLHPKPGVTCFAEKPKSFCAKEFLCNLV